MLPQQQVCRSITWITMATDSKTISPGFRIFDFNRLVSITPLVTFRIVFGLLMFFSLLRFWWRGWIDTAYLQPKFHFTYQGFEWVQSLGAPGMYLLFAVIIAAALFIAIGLFYRLAAVIFFIGFTYVELIDITTYLNHYYFISLVSFIMIWLPANQYYSVDVVRKPSIQSSKVPSWTINIIKFQLAIVYVFAGLAKINYDWLINAQPMRIWLPAKSHLPVVGSYLYETWVAYLFSWFGAAYDLFIVFFLLNKKTRPFAYIIVIVFHIATAIFFPGIGMFPYVMIVSTLIFFSPQFHHKILSLLPYYSKPAANTTYKFTWHRLFIPVIIIYVIIQLVVPLRFIFYPGHLFWHEEGYRFSWRVMLMEKAGTAYFTIKEKGTGRRFEVNNAEFLTPLQEKMMSTQPDMIVKFAHLLAGEYKKRNIIDPEVYGEIYVTLNGKRSTLFIDSTVNLAKENNSWKHYNWVLPYKR
jgi:hypothetical protein